MAINHMCTRYTIYFESSSIILKKYFVHKFYFDIAQKWGLDIIYIYSNSNLSIDVQQNLIIKVNIKITIDVKIENKADIS